VDALDDILVRIAERFEAHVAGLAEVIRARVRAEVAEFAADDPESWETQTRVVQGSRLSQAQHLVHGRAIPKRLADADTKAVRMAVFGDIPIGALLHAYRIGHDVSLEAWLDAVESVELPASTREPAVRAIIRFALEYNDALSQLIEVDYAAERKRVQNDATAEEARLVRDVVGGVRADLDGFNYDLALAHIGLILRGTAGARVARDLAKQLDGRLLAVTTPAGPTWAWIGRDTFGLTQQAALRDFTPPPETTLAVGLPQSGLHGFRRTHRQAARAYLVAGRRHDKSLTLYEDVALEGLVLREEPAAREFVADILGDLAGDDPRSAQLRTTIAAYFQSEQNRSATAARLKIHDATVARHLEEVEKRIGHRVNQRRVELETALRLRELVTREPDETVK
jgi:hypothetical protein